MRTFYSEYVQHCMRFYARHANPKFRSDKEREMLLTIYREGDTIPDNIYNLSVALEIKQDILWKLVNELERKVAKRRGLV